VRNLSKQINIKHHENKARYYQCYFKSTASGNCLFITTEQLVNSIYDPIDLLGVEFGYSIVVMTEEEKARFMQMEVDKWKGNINTNA